MFLQNLDRQCFSCTACIQVKWEFGCLASSEDNSLKLSLFLRSETILIILCCYLTNIMSKKCKRDRILEHRELKCPEPESKAR